MTKTKICSINGCGNKHLARGWCSRHYVKWRDHGDPLAAPVCYSDPKEAFKARTRKVESGCLEWIGAKCADGYGVMKVNGKTASSHRFAYEQVNGPIPDGTCVCHTCDNPACCKPEHLFLGAHKDNMVDMYQKGRGRKARGTAHASTHLTEHDVRAIRADPRKYREIAAAFGIGKSAVGYIKNRKTWSHVA